MKFLLTSHQKMQVHVRRAAVHAGRVVRSPYSLWGLAFISFVESALVVPVITDPFLAVYILTNRERAIRGIIITTAASVIGGLAAYFMALGFFEFVSAHYLTGQYGVRFEEIAANFHNDTFVLTILGALTPVPYTIVALAVGFLKGSILMFTLASVLGRGVRYTLVGYFTFRFGENALQFARARIALLTGICIILIAVYLLTRTIVS